jgi:hypothetical protein
MRGGLAKVHAAVVDHNGDEHCASAASQQPTTCAPPLPLDEPCAAKKGYMPSRNAMETRFVASLWLKPLCAPSSQCSGRRMLRASWAQRWRGRELTWKYMDPMMNAMAVAEAMRTTSVGASRAVLRSMRCEPTGAFTRGREGHSVEHLNQLRELREWRFRVDAVKARRFVVRRRTAQKACKLRGHAPAKLRLRRAAL